jgi:hypothetical protein
MDVIAQVQAELAELPMLIAFMGGGWLLAVVLKRAFRLYHRV